MALAIIVVVGLHVALPAKYRVNPPWVLPVVLLALLAALIIGDPGRIDRQKTWLRVTNRCQPSRPQSPRRRSRRCIPATEPGDNGHPSGSMNSAHGPVAAGTVPSRSLML